MKCFFFGNIALPSASDFIIASVHVFMLYANQIMINNFFKFDKVIVNWILISCGVLTYLRFSLIWETGLPKTQDSVWRVERGRGWVYRLAMASPGAGPRWGLGQKAVSPSGAKICRFVYSYYSNIETFIFQEKTFILNYQRKNILGLFFILTWSK